MDMDMNIQLEVSIVKRLEKLRQWQLEQQEKLMKQQQIQREILSHEQDLIYKALSLSVHDISDSDDQRENIPVIYEINAQETIPEALILQEDTETSDYTDTVIEEDISANKNDAVCKDHEEVETKDPNHVSAVVDNSRNSIKSYSSGVLSQNEELSDDLLIEGVKPLSQDKMPNKRISFDDIPLPSPKKDFKTLLEEKLKREPAVVQNLNRADTKAQMKKPFLRKGKGLSRYKISTNSHPSTTTTTRKCTLSSDTQRTDKSNRNNKSTAQKDSMSSSSVPANKTRQLNLKTVPLPRSKTVKSKPVTSAEQKTCSTVSNRPTHLTEMNVSDVDSKAEKELEEMRIFELMEEKAENSSFCSTSSTVLAFLQQSTPFKVRKNSSRVAYEGNIVTSTKQQSDKRGASNAIKQQLIIQPSARVENAKPGVRFEQSTASNKRSRTRVATVDSYWDTVVDDAQEEAQRRSAMVHQILQNEEAHSNYLDACVVPLSSSDEESNILVENNCNSVRDGETEMNHRVRFAEYNEYRTIDLTDTSDATSKSPLRDYLEQEDWHDRSGNTSESSESSDIEEKQVNYKEQALSLKMIDDNAAIVSSGHRLFSQQNIAKNSYYRVMKTLSIPEEDNTSNYKDESADENKEEEEKEIDEMSDEEMESKKEEIEEEEEERQSVLSSLSSSSDAQGKEYVLTNESDELTKTITKMCLNAKDVKHSSENRTSQTSTFEPELLKSRLFELEQEIDIFRKESSALLLQRRKLSEEHASLRKEYAEKEKTFEENRRRVQNQLEEERKRLTREKVAMENRIRDAQEKAKQNKMERQKAQSLQEELEELRNELSTKESRWNAAESRYKSELRALRVENSKLKQEIANLQNIRKTNMKNIRKSTIHGQVITRGINQINKRLTAVSAKEASTNTSQDSSNVCACNDVRREDKDEEKEENEDGRRLMEPIAQAIDVNSDFEQVVNNVSANRMESRHAGIASQSKCNGKSTKEDVARKKRHLYDILLKDATSDFGESQGGSNVTQDAGDLRQSMATQVENTSPKSNRVSEKSNDKSNVTNEDLCVTKSTEYCIGRSREVNKNPDNDGTRTENQEPFEEKRNLSPASYLSSHRLQTAGINAKADTVKQIQFADGRIEYWYPNGNVKKIFSEQGITKMIYYNGDVRETNKDGRVKYFYATTRTWHITTSDGVEILEFSNGQMEKRTSDGTVEVTFPDGSVQIVQADGTDKVSLPDGTVVQTFANGDKILTLPNGQREIHTKDHKRREYPDGTMKTIYVDGTQETRYSNGRRRLKDKDGNLLMDTYDNVFFSVKH